MVLNIGAVTFWCSLIFVFYAYVGYPVALWLLKWCRPRNVRKAAIYPHVSFIITAYNEERRIAAKLNNTLTQDYPKQCLEILVASDCSSDGTDAIVQSFEARGVRLARLPHKGGKEAAQQYAVSQATGDILVFSDVATSLAPNGITSIVKCFADPSVGCVSSIDCFVDKDGKVSGEGAYVRYEMWLRRLETQVNSIVGLSGSFFAARKEVCLDWAPDLQSDFNTLLNSIRLGLRGVSDEGSVGYYENLSDERKEYERKVRTVVRGISVFMRSLPLLNPLRYHIFAWQLISHKLCRWMVPFALIAALAASGVLALQSKAYAAAFGIQIFLYMVAAVYFVIPWFSKIGLFRLISFFVMVNLSILDAWIRYARGQRILSWTPSKR